MSIALHCTLQRLTIAGKPSNEITVSNEHACKPRKLWLQYFYRLMEREAPSNTADSLGPAMCKYASTFAC